MRTGETTGPETVCVKAEVLVIRHKSRCDSAGFAFVCV